jgi:hypothetical protein
MQSEATSSRKRLTTPRAAAVAGIAFAVLFTSSIVLIGLSMPPADQERGAWLGQGAGQGRIVLALTLMPFSGIAFLWFVGVVRDRLGTFEDQLFSTVFFGSGLLFLAMTFAAAAVAGGTIASYSLGAGQYVGNGLYLFGRAIMSQIFNTYALRMAGVFMISLGTLWLRTGVMPRWLSVASYLAALVLLLSLSLSVWMILIFPGWVFGISLYILVHNLRSQTHGATDGLAADVTTTQQTAEADK